MLLVKTKVGESRIPGAGKGLFADEFIPQGTPLWEFSSKIDEAFTKEEVEALPEPKRSEILGLEHAYISKKTGKYVNCGDDARYVNHSENPTMLILYPEDKTEDLCIAPRDIEKGEELTADYRVFAQEGVDFEI